HRSARHHRLSKWCTDDGASHGDGNNDIGRLRLRDSMYRLRNESVFDSSIVGPELKSRVDTCSDRDRYAVKWDGPKDRMIFVQSQNRQTHGLGDGNFITAPSRNASILNAITGKEIYEILSD